MSRGFCLGSGRGRAEIAGRTVLCLLLLLFAAAPIPAPAASLCDVDGSGVVDRNDVDRILADRGAPANLLFDPRDADADGWITVLDVRACTSVCTYTGCAIVVPPWAEPGPSRTVPVGGLATLSGFSSTDPSGGFLGYFWSFLSLPAGSGAALSDPFSPQPSFIPDLPGEYVLQLVVNNGVSESAPTMVTVSTVNSAPVADPGPDRTVATGSVVQLDGSGSRDVDEDPLSFEWSFASMPTASATSLSDSGAVSPTFVADRPGTYSVRLIVSDGLAQSDPAFATVSTVNSAPVADAGWNRRIAVPATVRLSGGGSTDVDGDPLSYRWSINFRPPGSAAVLDLPASVAPTFRADAAGTYVAQLVVNDGSSDSVPSTVVVSTSNLPPVSDAGPDRTAAPPFPKTVILDGSASFDPDGDPLTFRWALLSRPEGSGGTLTNPASVAPSLLVDAPGTYVVQLVVHDGVQPGNPDTASVSTVNSRPVADPGPGRIVPIGSPVVLDGSGSGDPNGNPLTFRWSMMSLPAGSNAFLSGPTTPSPSFTPDLHGIYVVQLIVRDGIEDSVPRTVEIHTNRAPTANAGSDHAIFFGTPYILFGTASDPDNDPLTYAWDVLSGPAGSTLTGASTLTPSFTANASGTYILRLTVSDGVLSASDIVALSLSNRAPSAAITGSGGTLSVGIAYATLSGSTSSDPDGDALTYAWSFTSRPAGSTATLSNATTVTPSFTPDRAGSYTVQLVVTDNNSTASSPVTATLSTTNRTPTAAITGAGGTLSVGVAYATLSGSTSSDPDGDALTCAWSFTSRPAGSTAALTGPTTATPTFTPDRAGSYTVQLVVTDNNSAASSPVTATLSTTNRVPSANAGTDSSVTVGTPYVLSGSASDPDSDPLTYSWAVVAGPAGSTLTGATTLTPSFTANSAGTYTLRLTVSDGVLSASDNVLLSTSNRTPSAAITGTGGTVSVGVSYATLSGGTSSDPDGDALTYAWSFTSRPAGSTAVFTGGTTATPTFTPDRAGSYTVQLVVTDNNSTASSPVTATLSTSNRTPTAAITGCGRDAVGGGGVRDALRVRLQRLGRGRADVRLVVHEPPGRKQRDPQQPDDSDSVVYPGPGGQLHGAAGRHRQQQHRVLAGNRDAVDYQPDSHGRDHGYGRDAVGGDCVRDPVGQRLQRPGWRRPDVRLVVHQPPGGEHGGLYRRHDGDAHVYPGPCGQLHGAVDRHRQQQCGVFAGDGDAVDYEPDSRRRRSRVRAGRCRWGLRTRPCRAAPPAIRTGTPLPTPGRSRAARRGARRSLPAGRR